MDETYCDGLKCDILSAVIDVKKILGSFMYLRKEFNYNLEILFESS